MSPVTWLENESKYDLLLFCYTPHRENKNSVNTYAGVSKERLQNILPISSCFLLAEEVPPINFNWEALMFAENFGQF